MPANSGSSSSRKPRRNSGRSPRNSDGFSVLELMVALLLFSALGIAVWSGLAGGQNLVARSIRTAAGTSKLLQMELYLRRTAALVRTPYWAPGPGVEAGAGSLRVSWLNGDPQQALLLSWGQGRLQVRTLEGQTGPAFGPFADVECDLYAGEHGASGLKVSVRAEPGDGEPLVVLAPFGGSPMATGSGR